MPIAQEQPMNLSFAGSVVLVSGRGLKWVAFSFCSTHAGDLSPDLYDPLASSLRQLGLDR
ncbi:MAG TPA: hypothetical protein VE242_07600, partial [Chthoniobacterales bacterium]|nr:hypothetical protein [Chthoniobacterales bacterium]